MRTFSIKILFMKIFSKKIFSSKKARIISLIVFMIALLISIDLGLNFLYNLIPEHDGITYRSFLQEVFRVFGDNGWTLRRFYSAFEKSVWITFIIMVENVVLAVIYKRRE